MKREDLTIGLTAAERDPLRSICFVMNDAFRILLSSKEKVVLSGRMGSGKSALALELEARQPGTIAIRPSKSTAVGLKALLRKLAASEEEDFDELFETAWRQLFVVLSATKVLEDCGNKYVSGNLDVLRRFVNERTRGKSNGSGATFLAVMSTALGQIVPRDALAGVEGQDYVTDEEAESCLRDLLQHKSPVHLVVDDIDRSWNRVGNVEYSLMRGLACATTALRDLDDDLRRCVVVHSFMPTHPFIEALGRQRQKIRPHIHDVTWSKPDLLKLMALRLRQLIPQADSPSLLSDTAVWRRIFVPRVEDPTTLFAEDSFQYVVNHTFFRPRDMIVMWDEIAKGAPEECDQLTADAVRNGVRAGCSELYQGILAEHAHVTYLKRLIGQFFATSNVVARSDFLEVLKGAVREIRSGGQLRDGTEEQAVSDCLSRLWELGFFGILVPDSVEGDVLDEMSWADQVVRNAVFSFTNNQANYLGAATYVIHPVFHGSLETLVERQVVIRAGA